MCYFSLTVSLKLSDVVLVFIQQMLYLLLIHLMNGQQGKRETEEEQEREVV